jgi:hypothetical protein
VLETRDVYADAYAKELGLDDLPARTSGSQAILPSWASSGT